jgi:large subunit ribosomal protein L30
MSETQDKPKAAKKKDVDTLLSEVTKATASAPKKAAAAKPTTAPAKATAAAASSKTIRIRQIKSGICAPVDQKLTLQGLGLRRIRHEVVRPDTPAMRGLIHKVRHLVAVVGE